VEKKDKNQQKKAMKINTVLTFKGNKSYSHDYPQKVKPLKISN
jgi:hypothetical protein